MGLFDMLSQLPPELRAALSNLSDAKVDARELPPLSGVLGTVLSENPIGALSWVTPPSQLQPGWTDDGGIVRLFTSSDTVAIGATTMSGTEKVRVVGNISADGTRPEFSAFNTGSLTKTRVAQPAVDRHSLTGNLYYDGAAWQRDDAGKIGWLWQFETGDYVGRARLYGHDGSLAQRLVVSADGELGVGVSGTSWDPAASLHVVQGGTGSASLRLQQQGTGGRSYQIISTGSGDAGGAGLLRLYDDTAAAYRLTITTGGAVIVGNATAPLGAEIFRVVGKVRTDSTSGTTFTINNSSNTATQQKSLSVNSTGTPFANELMWEFIGGNTAFRGCPTYKAYSAVTGSGRNHIFDVSNAGAGANIFAVRASGVDVLKCQQGGGVTVAGALTTGGLETQKAHAAFSGSSYQRTTSAVQTVDATQKTLATVALADDSTYWATLRVTARDTGGTKRAVYEKTVMAYRQSAGVATLGGAGVQSNFTDETTAAWDATFTVSSNNLLVSVTGEASTTINWACTLEYQRVSGAGPSTIELEEPELEEPA